MKRKEVIKDFLPKGAWRMEKQSDYCGLKWNVTSSYPIPIKKEILVLGKI